MLEISVTSNYPSQLVSPDKSHKIGLFSRLWISFSFKITLTSVIKPIHNSQWNMRYGKNLYDDERYTPISVFSVHRELIFIFRFLSFSRRRQRTLEMCDMWNMSSKKMAKKLWKVRTNKLIRNFFTCSSTAPPKSSPQLKAYLISSHNSESPNFSLSSGWKNGKKKQHRKLNDDFSRSTFFFFLLCVEKKLFCLSRLRISSISTHQRTFFFLLLFLHSRKYATTTKKEKSKHNKRVKKV